MLILVGAAIVWAGCYFEGYRFQLRGHATRLEGTVVELRSAGTGNAARGREDAIVEVGLPDGTTARYRSSVASSTGTYHLGERVVMLYDAGRGIAVFDSFYEIYGLLLFSISTGSVFVLLGLITLIAALRKRRASIERVPLRG